MQTLSTVELEERQGEVDVDTAVVPTRWRAGEDDDQEDGDGEDVTEDDIQEEERRSPMRMKEGRPVWVARNNFLLYSDVKSDMERGVGRFHISPACERRNRFEIIPLRQHQGCLYLGVDIYVAAGTMYVLWAHSYITS